MSQLCSDRRCILETVHYFHHRHLIMRNGDMMAILLAVEDFRELIYVPGRAAEIDRT